MHRPEDILLRRLAHGILLIIRENDHIFPLITEMRHKICRHVAHVVYTSPQLATLAKVVNTDKQGLAYASTT